MKTSYKLVCSQLEGVKDFRFDGYCFESEVILWGISYKEAVRQRRIFAKAYNLNCSDFTIEEIGQ